MPSASSVKQSANANAVEIADNASPIRQVLVSIEHKIRNLEKRKGKLESYRDMEKSGKELSNDQKVAVSKYNEVTQSLEFARDFSKQILQIATVSEKELKKKQKKDEMAKRQNEIAKIREVLIIQDVLKLLSDNETREDFLSGSNGACKLEKSEMDILDKFYLEVIPKRPSGPEDAAFKAAAQKCADHLLLSIEGKPKEFADSNYSVVKTILQNIQKCGYFDKAAQPVITEEADVAHEPASDAANTDEVPLERDTAVETEIVSQEFHEAPAAANVPAPTFPPQPQLISSQPAQIVQQVPLVPPIVPVVGISRVAAPTVPIPATGQLHPQHLAPTTVRAVEQAFFKQHQYMQQMRPLAEVIGTGNFFFLQDSELDSPDVISANYQPQLQPNPQISPSQPGTNQQLPPQQQQQPQQPPGIVQSSPQQQQPQQQISSSTQLTNQTFNNQTFQNIVPSPMYAVKPNDVSQNHISGYASANVPVAIPLVQSAAVPNHQQTQQSTPLNTSPNQMHNNNAPNTGAISSFPPTGKFIASNVSNMQSNLPKEKRHHAKDSSKLIENEQRVPEITEWKPEDATKPPEEITEWRDPYAPVEMNDWNEETNEDSNWSNNQRYQYRNNNVGNGTGAGSRDRNNRGSRPDRAGTNGYRNRQSNSYETNGGGRQSGNSGGERGGNGNTFYRNNDNFYQNGGSYKQEKPDGGYRGGNFRSRDPRDQINGTMRGSSGVGRPGPRVQRNSDSTDRDRERGPNTNIRNAQNVRPINKGGNSYGGGARGAPSTGNNTRPVNA